MNKKIKKRRIGFLNVVLALLIILVLIVVLGFILSVIYPDAGQKVRVAVASRLEIVFSGITDKTNDLANALSKRAQEGYQYRIRPFMRFVSSPLSKRAETVKTQGEKEGKEALTKKCLECHRDIFERTAIGHIYMDHEVHEKASIFCPECHGGPALELVGKTGKKHVEPPPSPAEDFCVSCHKKSSAKKAKAPLDCEGCHPPGSVLTSRVYSEERISAFVGPQKIRVSVPIGFEHGQSNACESCHDRPAFCDKCHGVREQPGWQDTHGANWVPIHRQAIEGNRFQPRDCWQCHSANWCSAACHTGERLMQPLPPGRPQIGP